ncbi:TPA: hypothetical protein JG821_004580 [Vibrio parahaemolyticus]|uniref:hypothetical protein n=1 Tax=Vibrio parahaemolyticus TaxID=670 RepID=UPI00111EC1BC|nr:hypothetical protein [Vibrio parahaemolyticus]ELB2184956.1 hypothetical protein [Vibrio parahaemolyticus]TOJ09621.1 hypothetical protein CGI45_24475 [Vibrio parahaemolyticus]HAS6868297.1 hypothetical protein [Vibrio parahaemolyticus]HAV1516286.1 hypothetical protein [Vibrio parahaemolyticus]HCH0953485.1 hypothetical protein [Vibrio parahaemolyticus]
MKNKLVDVLADNLDGGISSLIGDGILSDIPIVGNIINAFRIKQDVSNHLFSKKLESFLIQLKKHGNEELVTGIKDKDKLELIGMNMSLIINNANSIDKPKWLAESFISLCNQKISLDVFERVIYTIDAFSPALMKDLLEAYSNGALPYLLNTPQRRGKEHYEELANLGLLNRNFQLDSLNNSVKVSYQRTNLGDVLTKIIRSSDTC